MGHYLFTKLLMPTLLKSARTSKDPVRIVNLTSTAHTYAPSSGIMFEDIGLPIGSAMFGALPCSREARFLTLSASNQDALWPYQTRKPPSCEGAREAVRWQRREHDHYVSSSRRCSEVSSLSIGSQTAYCGQHRPPCYSQHAVCNSTDAPATTSYFAPADAN